MVASERALEWLRNLALKEGIFVGISAGAKLAAALEVAEGAAAGSIIPCMLPDTGERYLSTPLFEHIEVEMSTEEQVLADSTLADDSSLGRSEPLSA